MKHSKIFVVHVLDAREQKAIHNGACKVQRSKSHGDDSRVSAQRSDRHRSGGVRSCHKRMRNVPG